jgi:hypothetical protein
LNKKKHKKRAVTDKKQYHIITDIGNEYSDSAIVSFDNKEEVQDYLIGELQKNINYDFKSGNDIIIYGELKKVSVIEKTYKVNIK